MGDDLPELVYVVRLESLSSDLAKLRVLVCIGEQECVLGEPLEAVDDEPVLSPEDHEVLAAEFVKVGLEVAAVVVDRALRGLGQVVEGSGLGGAGMLADALVEEVDRLVELQLTDDFQMFLAGLGKQFLGLLDVVHRLLGSFRVALVALGRSGPIEPLAGLVRARVIDLRSNFVESTADAFGLLLYTLGCLGVVDLSFLPGIEVPPAVETSRRWREP